MRDAHCTGFRLLAAGALILAAAACSTSDYAAPIGAFATSAEAAARSFREMDQALARSTLDYAVRSVAADQSVPKANTFQRLDESCGTFIPDANVRCQTEFALASPFASVTLDRDDYTSPLGNVLGVLDATQEYAANLNAVQQANTIAEVNSSIDSIQASLTQLAKATAASGGQPPAIPADLPQAAGQAVKWVFGQYIESVKFRALRDATAAAREPLSQAQMVVTEIAKSAKTTLAHPLRAAAQDSFERMDSNSESSIRAMLAAQDVYDDFLTAPLSSMFDNLVGAHEDLAIALEEGSHLSVRRALDKMDEIEKQALMLEKIAKDLRAALEE